MSYSRRVDRNHGEMLQTLRQLGWVAHDTSRLGGGFPDAVIVRRGVVKLVEIKDGSKSKSRRKLTEPEQRVQDAFTAAGCPILVLESVDQAIAVLGRTGE